MDDSSQICDLYGKMIADEIKNVILICCSDSKIGFSLCNKLYFDVVVTDMEMPDVQGNQIIEKVKCLSPSTYTIIMTGLGRRMVYLAGKSDADDFQDKVEGIMNITDRIEMGLKEAEKRRHDILPADFKEKGFRGYHWRKRKKIESRLGIRLKLFETLGKRIRALALAHIGKNLSKSEIAFQAGYSSIQRMKESLKDLLAVLKIKSPLLT